jgi:hypothetical protein
MGKKSGSSLNSSGTGGTSPGIPPLPASEDSEDSDDRDDSDARLDRRVSRLWKDRLPTTLFGVSLGRDSRKEKGKSRAQG